MMGRNYLPMSVREYSTFGGTSRYTSRWIMWGELFGRPVAGEIVESFQRGGKDCVIKLYL